MNNNKKNKEFYDKGVKYHSEGELDKALKVCDKAISYDIKNTAIINLKGLILYQRGELDKAIESWNINSKVNNDLIAKSYLKDAFLDREKLDLYNLALKEIDRFKIDKAIELLKKCLESDFNTVKVNTTLGSCYFKKCEINKGKICLENALRVDKRYKEAKDLLKEINHLEGNKNKGTHKLYISIFLLMLILGGVFAINNFSGKDIFVSKFKGEESNSLENKKEKPKEIKKDKEEKSKDNDLNKEKNNFSKEEINIYLENNDFYSLARSLKGIDQKKLNKDDKKLYNRAKEVLEKVGVEKFYENGVGYFKKEEYKKASDEFKIALPYSKKTYLNEHILYFLGISESLLKNNSQAIKYLEEYYKYYPDGSYIEEVIYRLAKLNEKDDIDESKLYARILRDKYANSMYNNKNISKILDK